LSSEAQQGDKLTASATIQLTDDQRQKLLAARNDSKAPQYQLRLYACSEDHYKPSNGYSTYGNAVTRNTNVPIEFPGACEAKTNGYAIVANLKGIKKKPGTAPPANVGSATIHGKESTKASRSSDYALRIDSASQNNINRVELNYINTDKLHYMIVYFVEATGIDAIVERLKTQKIRTKEDVVKSCEYLFTFVWI
jgi:E3 SUMO-protein ligase PIAS1